MRNKFLKVSVCVILFLFSLSNAFSNESAFDPPKFTLVSTDRILILAPHPDDEVLGCAGIIQQAKQNKIPVKVVFLTYGDNNEWSFLVYKKRPVVMPGAVKLMGQTRHDEAVMADRMLGVDSKDIVFLGYPDFGTLAIWNRHWDDARPLKSMLTKVKNVPYKNAFRPGAPYKGEEILNDIETIIKNFKPTKIFVSHPVDHNTDHRAFYLFTQIALWETHSTAEIYPYLIHFKKWEKLGGYQPEVKLEPPAMLIDQINWKEFLLSAQQINRKEQALKKHKSQYIASPKYLESFIRLNELFGDFPVIRLKDIGQNPYISLGNKKHTDVGRENLSDAQRSLFIGLEERQIRLENDQLVLTIKLSRPLGKTLGLSAYVFGYRDDTAFPKMPKLHVRLGAIKYAVYDQKKKISPKSIKVRHGLKEISISIPLKLLGNPTRVLTSAQTYLDRIPLDWVAWRIVELP